VLAIPALLLFAVNHPPHSELHLDPLQLVYANAYVLLGLGAPAVVAWRISAQRYVAIRRPLAARALSGPQEQPPYRG